MEEISTGPSRRTISSAWTQLYTAGTASAAAAHLLKIGIQPFLDEFGRHFLGRDGIGQGFKLLLGMNGEGKTHLLFCLRELALRAGHPVALVDAKSCGAGDPWAFALSVLEAIEIPASLEEDSDERPIVRLLRDAAERKRTAAESKGLDPGAVFDAWTDAIRGKALMPHGFADALADGLQAALDGSAESINDAVARLTFQGVRMSRPDAERNGASLLRSLPLFVKCLDLQPLVILLDEAETAVEKKGSARRKEFLKFLRFLFDHVAIAGGSQGAIVVIGCTDEFWPHEFNNYEALRQRLSDAGRDTLEDRAGLSARGIVRLNKLWVRETFKGEEADYDRLGKGLIDFAALLYPEVDRNVQGTNAARLARVASGDAVRKQVKRNFVKALAQTIERQIADESQAVLEEREASRLLDAARQEIQEHDAE